MRQPPSPEARRYAATTTLPPSSRRAAGNSHSSGYVGVSPSSLPLEQPSRRSKSLRWSSSDGSGTSSSTWKTTGDRCPNSAASAARIRSPWMRLAAGTSTAMSSSTRTWQARRHPSSSSRALKNWVQIAEAGSLPEVSRTAHLPHTPFPPQGASMLTPALATAQSSFIPFGTCVLLPSGSTVTVGIALLLCSSAPVCRSGAFPWLIGPRLRPPS